MSAYSRNEYADAIQILASAGHAFLATRLLVLAIQQERVFKAQERVDQRQARLDTRTNKLLSDIDIVVQKRMAQKY